MDSLRNWIVNICTTVFFITAVEMILPNNNLKKYSRFVLGIILMTVILNPLVKFLNKGTEVTAFINKSVNSMDNLYKSDNEEYRKKSINDTLDVFKTSLEDNCTKELTRKYPKGKYKVEIDVGYNTGTQEYEIRGANVGKDDGKIGKVGKIEIGASSLKKDNQDNSKEAEEVKNYLSGYLGIAEEKIAVYKLTK